MRVQFDRPTRDKLQAYLGERPGTFKLFYDVEDCGCNGMLVLQIVDAPSPTDRSAESEAFAFVVDNRQQDQFDPVMVLEADPHFPTFKVKSDAALYGSNVKLRDLRS